MLEVKQDAEGVSFRVRVAPRASRSSIQGVHAGALKVSLCAPPVDGEANAALCELLARKLRVAKRAVTITHGQTAKLKTVRVQGASEGDLQVLLAADT